MGLRPRCILQSFETHLRRHTQYIYILTSKIEPEDLILKVSIHDCAYAVKFLLAKKLLTHLTLNEICF